ncbi:MAG: hypothetical protein CM1200mP22_23550 [Dehalococcoidia bacterium]|nr:MAG: hypothetical protein CM1200mP22_23550 [Dehalococcoidia bacterium]
MNCRVIEAVEIGPLYNKRGQMIYNAERGDISIAVGGDAMITRRMSALTSPIFWTHRDPQESRCLRSQP